MSPMRAIEKALDTGACVTTGVGTTGVATGVVVVAGFAAGLVVTGLVTGLVVVGFVAAWAATPEKEVATRANAIVVR